MPDSALGLQTGFAVGEESPFGTAVLPSRAYEILNESLERQPNRMAASGLRSGALHTTRGTRYVETGRGAGGSFSLMVPTTGFGILLKHAIGGTPTVVQQGGTTAWLQTHAFGSNAGYGLTIQKQMRTGANGLVERYNYIGSKILSVEFSIDTDGILTASFEVDSKDEETSTATAALSYPTNTVFRFDQGSLILGGSALAKVTGANVKVERPQSVKQRFLGTGGLAAQPVENARPKITGNLNCQFDTDIDTAVYDRFVSNAAALLQLSFTGANISGIYNSQFSITIPEIHFEGETPKAGGEGEITLNAPFVGMWDGLNADITVAYTSTDNAI